MIKINEYIQARKSPIVENKDKINQDDALNKEYLKIILSEVMVLESKVSEIIKIENSE